MFHALPEICITLGSILRRIHSLGFPSPCGVLGWFRDAGISRRSFVTSGSRDIMYIVVRLRSLVAEFATEHFVGDVHHRCSLILISFSIVRITSTYSLLNGIHTPFLIRALRLS